MVLYWMLVFMNVLGFYLMRADKRRAQKKRYRISERMLWTVAVCGGAVGSTVGMQLYRHKTKHTAFIFGFPLLAIIQLLLYSYFF